MKKNYNIKLSKGQYNVTRVALDHFLEEMGGCLNDPTLKKSDKKEFEKIYNSIKNTITIIDKQEIKNNEK
mgnify:CR=1 FL=1|tara:strand:+ start:770 stop:979 length:210 start_codon:yes stop_codon:yes gene_type:complete